MGKNGFFSSFTIFLNANVEKKTIKEVEEDSPLSNEKDVNRVDVLKNLTDIHKKREYWLQESEKVVEEKTLLQQREDEINEHLRDLNAAIEDYGIIRYTEEFLSELIAQEKLRSKRRNLENIRQLLLEGKLEAESIVALLELDREVQAFMNEQSEMSKLAKLFRNIKKIGGNQDD